MFQNCLSTFKIMITVAIIWGLGMAFLIVIWLLSMGDCLIEGRPLPDRKPFIFFALSITLVAVAFII